MARSRVETGRKKKTTLSTKIRLRFNFSLGNFLERRECLLIKSEKKISAIHVFLNQPITRIPSIALSTLMLSSLLKSPSNEAELNPSLFQIIGLPRHILNQLNQRDEIWEKSIIQPNEFQKLCHFHS